ncbi:MAG: pyruvate kinase [Acidobacteriota bacterium]|nr:MAG: pyruvate kinase [Acidobacteriota bacterium]
MRKAKILATIGPASNEPAVLDAMIAAGMNAVRINMSHGSREQHQQTLENVRAAALRAGKPIAELIDLSGPKIRTRTLTDGKPVLLTTGERFVITTRDIAGDAHQISTNFAGLPQAVNAGSRILLDDGAIELLVEEVADSDVICRVVTGGILSERKGINLPNTALPIPSLTEKDRADLEWAVEQNVDYIALSFVRTAEDCREVKDLIKKLNKRKLGRALLVAKIEKSEAVDNLLEIIDATDGLMVARGDLGVETSVELVPVYQKRIIELAVANDRFVITATQMLQSMIENPFPTRAEASDVANAVWDGTDAVMLSAETASGNYPVEAIETMARIIDSAETIRPEQLKKPVKFSQPPSARTSQALCKAAAAAAKEMQTDKIAVFTESGLMARRLSSFRSGLATFALTTSGDSCGQLALIWGVTPLFDEGLVVAGQENKIGEGTMLDLMASGSDATVDMLKTGENTLLDAGVVENGETIVMLAGRLSGLGLSSSVNVWTIGEDVARR